MIAGSECKYPQREKKVTLLESQLNKLRDRIVFLESKLEQTNTQRNSGDLIEHEGSTTTREELSRRSPLLELEAKEEPSGSPSKSNDQAENHELSIPFNTKDNVTGGNTYFGTSSGQVFDSELKSHLFEITEDSDKISPRSTSSTQRRHFFRDPTLESSFSGVVMLPNKDYALSLVSKVIKYLSHEYYLFDAEKFLSQIDEAYEKLRDKKPLWICYFLMTLAVGEQYQSHSPNGEVPGMGFYIAAMRLYRSSYEEPTPEFVQTLLLIAFYLQGLNSANAAFSFYGLAMRSALIQGLHRNISFISPEEKEKRKRLWWTVFVMDNIWCANLGHPIHVRIEDIDVDYPEENSVDLHDDFNIELLDYNTRLATILGSVMKDVYCPAKGASSIKVWKVLECVEKFDKLRDTLPETIKNNLLLSDNRSAANLYLRLNHYTIVTTRPLLLSLFKGHVQPTEPIKKVVSRCVMAAISSIDILTNLKNNDWLSAFGFWDAQSCFSALLILNICSFAGNVYAQTETGRNINKYMRDAGNFTALDNELKLVELDELLSKIPTYSNNFKTPTMEMVDNERKEQQATTLNTPETVNSHRVLDPELQLRDSVRASLSSERYTQNSHLEADACKAAAANGDPAACDIFSQAASIMHHHPVVDIEHTVGTESAIWSHQPQNPDQIGDFTAFRNNISPDTWNELTHNLQFWDPTSNY